MSRLSGRSTDIFGGFSQRETQIYDRNRETLFDVRDHALRARTHLLLLQVGLTLDSVFEAAKFIEDSDLEGGEEAAIGRGAVAIASREGGFSFLMDFRPQLPELIVKYEKIAKQSFDAHDLVLQGPRPQAEPATG